MFGWEIKLVLQSLNKDPKRREKFKKVDIKMTLETAKNSVNRAQNGENTQKKD